MRNVIMSVLAALAASVYGFTPQAHTNTVTRDGVTYVQRGALGAADYVVTNVDAQTVGRVQSVNGKTGTVVLGADDVGALTNTTTHLSGDVPTSRTINGKTLTSDITLNAVDVNARPNDWTPNASQVGALPDNQESLEANANFRAAVATVSPPAEIPAKWALANITNATGEAVAATDVGAVPANKGTTAAVFPFKLRENNERTSTGITIGWETVDYYDSYGDYISFSPIGFKSVCDGLVTLQKNWRDLAIVSNFDSQPTYQSNNGVKSGGVYSWADGRYLKSTDASTTYLRQDTASTTYETKQDATSKLDTATEQTTAVSNMVTTLSSQARMKDDFSIVTTKDDWNVNQVVAQYSSYTDFFIFKVFVFDDSTPYGMMVQAKNPQGGTWFPISDSEETWDTPEAVRAATQFTCGYVYDPRFSFINGKKIDKYYVVDGGRIANTNDINIALQNYVPTTRKVNGQALTSDITIQGMTADAVVLTNGTLKTYDGRTVDAMDYPALTNTVNAVKAQYWDAPLAVNWTVDITNGDMHFSATTNVNQSVLN